jgi:hypothetical protein
MPSKYPSLHEQSGGLFLLFPLQIIQFLGESKHFSHWNSHTENSCLELKINLFWLLIQKI